MGERVPGVSIDPIDTGGRVRRGIEERTGRPVAVKRCASRRAAIREARLLRRAGGLFTPALVARTRTARHGWLVTEWIDGEPLDASDPSEQLTSLLRALVHLHRRGIVHGDVKPAHVRFVDGRCVLLDLDLGARVGEVRSPEEDGATPAFAAPEKRLAWPADPRSDLYSLGKILAALPALPASLEPIADALRSVAGGDRPWTAESLLPAFRDALGPGVVPTLSLRHLRWRPRSGARDLTRAIETSLGVDAIVASRVARCLLMQTGGVSGLIDVVWERWLHLACPDPWCPLERARFTEVENQIRGLAAEASTSWFEHARPAHRLTCGVIACGGSSVRWGHVQPHIETMGVRRGLWTADDASRCSEHARTAMIRSGVLTEIDDRAGASCPRLALSSEAMAVTARRWMSIEDAGRVHDARLADPTLTPEEIAWHRTRREATAARDAYLAAAEAAWRSNDSPGLVRCFEAAWPASDRGRPARVARHLGVRDTLVWADRMASALPSVGRTDEADRWIAWFAAHATTRRLRARSERLQAARRYRDGDLGATLAHCEAGLAGGDVDPETEGRLRQLRASARLRAEGPTDAVVADARVAVRLLRRAGLDALRCTAALLQGALLLQRGEHAAARRLFRGVLGVARRHDLSHPAAAAHVNLFGDFDDENTVIPPEAVDREGPTVEIIACDSLESEATEIAALVERWSAHRSAPKSIGILYPTSRHRLGYRPSRLAEAMNERAIDYYEAVEGAQRELLPSAAEPSVLLSVHSAKGLEFPSVILWGLYGRETDELAARSLAYVGMTRATERLAIVVDRKDPLLKYLPDPAETAI